MLGAVFGILSTILSFIGSIPLWIIALFAVILLSFFDVGRDIFAWIFEQFLDVVIIALDALPSDFSMFNPATYVSWIPQDVVNIMILIKFPEVMAMITTALVIRFFLQLIPFVRLGS